MPNNHKNQKHIGHLIKRIREKRKVSAYEVAHECKVTRGRIYQWEEARYILPKNFAGLARALQISVKTLEAANGKSTYVPKTRRSS